MCGWKAGPGCWLSVGVKVEGRDWSHCPFRNSHFLLIAERKLGQGSADDRVGAAVEEEGCRCPVYHSPRAGGCPGCGFEM